MLSSDALPLIVFGCKVDRLLVVEERFNAADTPCSDAEETVDLCDHRVSSGGGAGFHLRLLTVGEFGLDCFAGDLSRLSLRSGRQSDGGGADDGVSPSDKTWSRSSRACLALWLRTSV